ncbi:MAG TPA: tripartite tricarboxylate transporter substrate binding protein [Xanthobacteraceae bacterium]|nr:tripartite tricarboxylate transporter substrate binding protein [Xanthobacteraceae bacterium]
MHRPPLKSLSLWLLALSASLSTPAQAQDYPIRPVKIISDSAPGSAVDVTLRMVADRLGQVWGQQVLPVNQPGGGGVISARVAAEAVPDGYTLYMPALSVFLPAPGKAANTALELPRDFAPIGSVTEQPMFIAAAPSLGVSTLPELIALAKRRPGEISYAVTGVGRLTHLTGELLQLRTGIKLLLVPYSGGPSHSLNDIMGGRIQFIIEAYQGLAGAIQGGNLKPLAVASAQRLPDFPDLPTVAETVPGFVAMGWQGLMAPVGTPETIIRKASEDLRKVISDPALKAQLAGRGSYPVAMSPTEVTAFIQDQQRQWSPVLQQLATKP